MFSKIIVNSPWYSFLLSFALGLVISLWLYYRNKKNTDAPKKILLLLFGLRFLSVSLILLFLLNLFIRRLQNETEYPIVILAVDNSSSILSSVDSTFIKTDFQKNLQKLKSDLEGKYQVKQLLFGSVSRTSDESPSFTEKETDIENLLEEVENNYSNQNIGALVIASDGIINKGANPLYSVDKLKYPVYTLALGDTTETKDVLIQKINHNQIAYAGNNFPVEVIIQAKKYKGKEVIVELLENGVQKSKQITSIVSDNFLSSATFTLSASNPGIVRYTAKISCLNDEKNCTNNIQNFVIEVIDNKDKLLLLAANPHPDVAALKEALSLGTNYEIEYSLTGDFRKNIKAYNVVIFHGFNSLMLPYLADCKNSMVPYWIVDPTSPDNIPGLKISSSLNKFNDSEVYPDNTFGLFNLSDGWKKFSGDLPALKTFFGNYSLVNGTNVLLKQKLGNIETENPILFFSETNSLKSAVFIGDGLWKWKMRDFAEHQNHNLFNELINKSVQYLSVKNDKSFFRIVSQKIINENEAVELGAELYNKSYEPITEPDVILTLTNSAGKKFNYTFSKTGSAYKLNLGMLEPGEYRYQANTKNNNELFVKQGVFIVKEVISEKINTVANHSLLYQLSKRSNGKFYYPAQLQNMKEDLLNSEYIKPVTYTQTSTSLLIEVKWLFWLILILMTIEWFFRKRFLSI